MIERDCKEYKDAKIWKPVLRRWCIAKRCPDRKFAYGSQERKKKKEV